METNSVDENGTEQKDVQDSEKMDIAGAVESDAKWPRPVDFRENDPKKGYVYVLVTVPELRVSASLVSKNKPENIDVYNPAEIFREKEIYLRVKTTNSDGQAIVYEYKKKLPKPINPKMSDVKYEKGIIKLRMKKEDPSISWAPFSKYLRSKEATV